MSWQTRSRLEGSRTLAASTLAALAVAATVSPACLSRPLETIEPRTTSTLVEKFTQHKVDKIDILLGIDDSRSMADKQAILAMAVPDLIDSLVNPPCLDEQGALVVQPSGPLVECPAGSHREFEPVLDIHIGVIDTSLGPRGSSMTTDACPDDGARLLSRTLAGELETYDGKGFLAWDPTQQLRPPGHADPEQLQDDLKQLVAGVGEEGCGYEAQLESWYRFLVDPEPYERVQRNGSRTELVGVDTALLAERQVFLRPDSLVAIIMLSDENDCSFRAEGQGFFTAENESLYPLKARAECAVDTADPCCAPCGYAPESCPADPSCADEPPPTHGMRNLNCFRQKERYGYDFLYPVSRYVEALTLEVVPDRAGNLVDNPLFVSTADGARYVRPKDRVFLAGIVGVPWQDIARHGPAGPSLEAGLKTARELREDGVWDVILGDPAAGVPPQDPHMVEAIEPRSGTNPLTGDRIAPVDSLDPWADSINGHEFQIRMGPNAQGDRQYACIFDLPPEHWVDCSTEQNCDCEFPDEEHKPLCQADDGSYSTLQRRAKAYPSLRQLEVLEGIGDQAIVASICPAEIADERAPEFGYRPAIAALTERLKEQLGDPCLARSFTPDETGRVPCIILEGRALEPAAACDCQALGRRPVSPEFRGAEVAAAEDPVSQISGLSCFCEIVQLTGEERSACQTVLDDEVTTATGQPVHGWCYVDATTAPPIGNPQLVDHCPAVEQRTIRFVGEGRGQSGATLFLTCQQEG